MDARITSLILFLWLFSGYVQPSFADNSLSEPKPTGGLAPPRVKVIMATGSSQAPYSVRAGRGILEEIFAAAFEGSAYEAEMKYLDNESALQQFDDKLVDGITMVNPEMVDAYLSKSYVIFQNAAIFLQERGYKIKAIEDLTDYRVLAFSNASKYLGAEFAAMAEAHPHYETIVDQMEQIRALYEGRTDIIISDRVIYQFYLKKLIYSSKLDRRYAQEVVLRDIFPPNFYHAAFQDEAVRDAFNKGYEEIEKNGKLVEIYKKYTELLIKY